MLLFKSGVKTIRNIVFWMMFRSRRYEYKDFGAYGFLDYDHFSIVLEIVTRK
jgi:hypothetical protein